MEATLEIHFWNQSDDSKPGTLTQFEDNEGVEHISYHIFEEPHARQCCHRQPKHQKRSKNVVCETSCRFGA